MDLVYNYDLVVYIIASLSIQRSITPKERIMCTLKPLKNMEHLVGTSFKESDTTFVGDK